MDILWRISDYCSFQDRQLTSSDIENHKQFCKAIQRRDIQSVQDFIQKGASVNSILLDGINDFEPNQTPLHLAVISRCPEIVKILLDNGAKQNSRTAEQETPLIMAAKTQNTTVIDLLLLNEFVYSWDNYGLSHLHIACMRGNLAVAKSILLHDGREYLNLPVYESSMYWPGFTPLHFAVHFEQFETVQFLLDNGADMMVKDTRKCTPLHLAHFQRHEGIIDLLLSAHKYYFTNPTDAQGLSHFHIACSRDDASVVEHFLKFSSNLDSETEEGWKPIHFALYYECSHVIDVLSKSKFRASFHSVTSILKQTYILQNHIFHNLSSTEKTVSDDFRETPLPLLLFYDSCIQNDVDKLEHLISIGVISNDFDLNMPVSNGCTPLHLAVRSRAEGTAVALLDHGANFMLQDAEGKTVLHLAFELSLNQVLDRIFRNFNNQSPNLVDKKGMSVFHILCTRDKQSAIEDFLRRGVDINSQVGSESACWAGFTPIHFAIMFKRYLVVDILLRHGADISVKNELGYDSLELAFRRLDAVKPSNQYKIFEIIRLILQSGRNGLGNFDDRGISPLHEFCFTNHGDDPDEMQQYLISHEGFIDKPIEFPIEYRYNPFFNKKTPLTIVMLGQQLRQALLLIEKGADLSRMNHQGLDPLELAFTHGLLEGEYIDLAENICNIAIASIERLKPTYFHKACASGLPNVVKNFLENCTDKKLIAEFVNYRNDVGQTPLHSLLLQKIEKIPREKIVKLLLENGSDINARDYMLRTPLHCVKKATDLGITRMLLEYGADVNAQNVFGQTPLHDIYAEFFDGYDRDISDHTSLQQQIICLLESGFDMDIADKRGRTCLTIVNSLLRANQDENDDADNPLELILASRLLEYVRKLQIIGVDFNDKNEQAFHSLRHKDTPYNESVFDERCRQEIDFMMSVKLDRRLTMFQILTESLDRMAFYCENTVLRDAVMTNDFARLLIYGPLIILQIKRGLARRSLLEKSEEILKLLIGRSLPHECLEKILRYLSNSELESVISSGSDSIHDEEPPE